MYAFKKSLKRADHTRRFTIRPSLTGWEVRDEHDDHVVRHSQYQDWHRVEHARRAFVMELQELTENGWQEVLESES